MGLYKVNVEIAGISEMLHNRNPMEKTEMDRVSYLQKILSKDPSNSEAYTEIAGISLYKNSKKEICIPSSHIEASMVKAGVQEKVEGQGKKTYKDYMKAFIIIEPELIPIQPQKYDLFRTWVKTYGGRIISTRPRFSVGWKAKFNIAVLDSTIPFKTVQNILGYAGAYVGIGNWRPKFGRFETTKFEKQE